MFRSSISLLLISFLFANSAFAQCSIESPTLCVGPGQYAFQYTLDNDYGLVFNSVSTQYEFRNGTAQAIFAFDANNGLMKTNFGMSAGADFLVGPDRYAFRYSGNSNIGLFFNASAQQYEFKSGTGSASFTVEALTGNVNFTGVISGNGSGLTNLNITESQTLALAGNDLTISGGNTVDLSSIAGSTSPWTVAGGLNYYNGVVSMGTTTSFGALLNIQTGAVPLSFRELGQDIDDGGLWRLVLDNGSMRFDMNTHPTTVFSTNETKFYMAQSGNVGLGGTKSPDQMLEVSENVLCGSVRGATLIDDPGLISGRGLFVGNAGFVLDVDNGALNLVGRAGMKLFSGDATGTAVEAITITTAGDVGILTSTPQSEFAVNGTITAKAIEVTVTGWPDFVFDNEYELMPLLEVESFIEIEKHLPGISSESEIIEEGLNLGEMQAAMMQKIEELTLYIIDQEKRIITLEKENTAFKK